MKKQGGVWAYLVVLGMLAVPVACLVSTAAHLPAAGVAAETTNPIPGLTAAQTDSLWSLVLGAGIILTVAAIVRGAVRSHGPKTITGNPGPELGAAVEPWAANMSVGETMQRVRTKRPAYRLDLFSTSHEQDAIDRATPITEMSVDLRSERAR